MVLADTPRMDNVVATVTAGAAVDELLARRLSDLTVFDRSGAGHNQWRRN